jgi:hypothetical protein
MSPAALVLYALCAAEQSTQAPEPSSSTATRPPLAAPPTVAAALPSPAPLPSPSAIAAGDRTMVVVGAQATPAAPIVHGFWDWQNDALFAGVTAARMFDFLSTRKFREKHLKEWFLDDKTVDNRPLFMTIEVAGSVASVGASYALHRWGYHRLERWASIIHIAVATAGGVWNCTLPNGL